MKVKTNNSFFTNNIFKNKSILIIVPHQDDEINIAGGLIASISNENKNIRVLYTTNGDFCMEAKVRYSEAIKSLKKLGVKKENAIFMGYSDQPYDQQTHLYNTDAIWTSRKNYNKTYGTDNIKEWSYNKHKEHNSFTKENFKNDIKEIILYYKPEVIICVDNDFHPDHIATSLSFDRALGEILNDKTNKYYPIVLKTFTYENSYLGEDDFNTYNIEGMKFDMKNGKLVNNLYYTEENAIRIPLLLKAYNINLNKNIVWKAIQKHKSQLLVKNAFRIINSNNVYWKRNTHNLLNDAEIITTSSDSNLLHDFILCDSDYILNGNKNKINYNKGIWIPAKEDNEKKINILFKEKKHVDKIKFYHGVLNNDNIKKIEITINNKSNIYELTEEKVQTININESLDRITIRVLDKIVNNGFSEIEVLEQQEENINYIKGLIDNKWINNFITKNKKETEYKVTTYSYNTNNNIEIDANNLKNGKYENEKLFLTRRTKGYIIFYEKNNNNIYDIVYINKNRFKYDINIILNYLKMKINIFITKVYRKIFISRMYY